jgi:protein O-mannosyl-transferase
MVISFSKIKSNRVYGLIILLTFLIYGNSINNEYALDDNIVVDGVAKVNKGIKSIPIIFKTHHAVDNKQSYGYRPLVSVTFALEKQFFKGLPEHQTKEEKKKKDRLTQANISHLINLLIYAITGIVLFNFLSLLFSNYNQLLPLFITVLFIVHPLHTEPVANIKSRDELMMFLFMISSLVYFLKYINVPNIKYLFLVLMFVMASYLSKKNGIQIIGILPVLMYYKSCSLKKIIIFVFGLFALFMVSKFLKHGLLTATEIREVKYFENPLFYTSNIMDRITVGLYCSWFYLKMLIFPKDLSFYYGYNQIPMANWSFYEVWLAILFYVPIGVYGFWMFIKRKAIGIGIAIWFGLLLGVNNLFSPVVGIVADRFTYSLSLGFCIVVAFLLLKWFKLDAIQAEKIKLPNNFVFAFLAIFSVYSIRTIVRNPDWHDYLHLYTADIEHLEESAKAHALISNTLYPLVKQNPQNPKNREYVNDIILHYKKAIEIDSTYLTCYSNLGSTYISMLRDYKSGIYYCGRAIEMDNDYVEANLNVAVAYENLNIPDSALKYYGRVIEINPDYLNVYNILNTFLTKKGDVNKGIEQLKHIAQKSAAPKNIYTNIANLYTLDATKMDSTILFFEKAFNEDRNDQILSNHLSKLYQMRGNIDKANYYRNITN